ncbi:MAG: stage V sporulation T C-terminal domain-containing protein [Ruminococcus sp.]
MDTTLKIAGYCRISVDEELDRDNTSIENQKAIILDYAKRKFPESSVDFYEDRDRSGYTFEQREGYQQLRRKMMNLEYDILVVKDFSRFSRRNSKGLVELEDLRDRGMRIISVGDSIDYPTYDDWTAIQFRFLINEMPVTDTSKKVKSVIKRRQEEGKWICSVPYGYLMVNNKNAPIIVDEPAAEIIREIFDRYLEGWGYKKIANYLTDKNFPTPRMAEKMRKERNGEECRLKAKREWSIITVSEILQNDFYIGTLRQGKYKRQRINGKEIKQSEVEHIVFENNHKPIVDFKTFAAVQEQIKKRSTTGYRGVKKYDNVYSGYMVCGDCGAPMFSMSRGDLAPAYTCGSYHRRGLKGCTSHHTRTDMLDELLKDYIRVIRDNSEEMIERLKESLEKEKTETKRSKSTVETLQKNIADIKEEIRIMHRMKARDIIRDPDKEDIFEEIYGEQIDELTNRLDGLRNQLNMTTDKHNTAAKVNRVAKTVFEIFDDIINKPSLQKKDLDFILEKIVIYENRIDIQLKADIDALLTSGRLPDTEENIIEAEEKTAVNFEPDVKNIVSSRQIVVSANNRKDKVFDVNVIRYGDPLEIYTNSDGEVIFKKYSAISEMSENAVHVADIMFKIAGCPVVIFDKDHVVASAGVPRKEFSERRVTGQLEELMESRGQYFRTDNSSDNFHAAEGVERMAIAALPIICSGDVMGAVAFLESDTCRSVTDLQKSLINASAQFLARQIEG